MDWACFANAAGSLTLGRGPFTATTEQPSEGIAFYRNDFSLSIEKPWLIPAESITVENLAGIFSGREPSPPEWEAPEAKIFAKVFEDITERIRRGSLEKSVPVVTERGTWHGPPRRWNQFPAGLSSGMRLFGWGEGEEGLLSATPEQLFHLEGETLTTMALAGTARIEDAEVFEVDEKEIREHEFVAQTLMAKLGDLGTVSRKPREILNLGELIHFHTPIEVQLDQPESAARLIRRLHPTPALGPLPRTAETLEAIGHWRDLTGCPGWFGAPFGLSRDGIFEALVGIRMVLWQGKEVQVPAGCGVIEPSRLVNEWRELRLKREAVKRVFGFI